MIPRLRREKNISEGKRNQLHVARGGPNKSHRDTANSDWTISCVLVGTCSKNDSTKKYNPCKHTFILLLFQLFISIQGMGLCESKEEDRIPLQYTLHLKYCNFNFPIAIHSSIALPCLMDDVGGNHLIQLFHFLHYLFPYYYCGRWTEAPLAWVLYRCGRRVTARTLKWKLNMEICNCTGEHLQSSSTQSGTRLNWSCKVPAGWMEE